jgi:hypothetical protein
MAARATATTITTSVEDEAQQTTGSYVAIRKGKTVKNCIFLCWDDCKEQIEGFDAAEYSTFSSLTLAETYLRIETSVSAKNIADATVFAECLAVLPPLLPPCSPPRMMEQEVERVMEEEQEEQDAVETTTTNATTTSNRTTTSPTTNRWRQLPNIASDITKRKDPPTLRPLASIANNDEASAKQGALDTAAATFTKKANHCVSPTPPPPPPTTPKEAAASSTESNRGADVAAPPPKKRRGRPPKNAMPAVDPPPAAKKKKRGRPKGSATTKHWKPQKRPPGSIEDEPLEANPSPIWWELYLILTHYQKRHSSVLDGTRTLLVKTNVRQLLRDKCISETITYATVRDWCKIQRDRYIQLTDEQRKESIKVQRLNAINFDWTKQVEDDEDANEESEQEAEQEVEKKDGDTPVESTPEAAAPSPNNQGKEEEASHVPPTSRLPWRWEAMLQQLVAYKGAHGTFDVPTHTTEDYAKLRKWVDYQRLAYRKVKLGGASEHKTGMMTKEKIEALQTIGFQLDEEGRKPSKRWELILERFKQHVEMEKSFEIDITTTATENNENDEEQDGVKERRELKTWIADQRAEYRSFRERKKSAFSEEKVRRLAAIGYEFEYVPFAQRLEQLKAFIQEHGTRVIPKDHELSKWARKAKLQIQRLEEGKKGVNMTQEQADELKELGFFTGNVREPVDTEEEIRKWEENFENMRRYKEENGDCLVGTAPPHDEFKVSTTPTILWLILLLPILNSRFILFLSIVLGHRAAPQLPPTARR